MTIFFETENPVTKEQIKNLEEKLRFNFPFEYKHHLLKNNGGRCEPNLFSFKEKEKLSQSSLDWFLALYDGEYDNLENYFNSYKIEEKRMPDSVFPIGHDPVGNLICMDANDCKIYFWDHEKEVDYNYFSNNDRSNLYLIAETFDLFLSNLNSEYI